VPTRRPDRIMAGQNHTSPSYTELPSTNLASLRIILSCYDSVGVARNGATRPRSAPCSVPKTRFALSQQQATIKAPAKHHLSPPPVSHFRTLGSSPEMNLVLLEGCWLLFWFLSPLPPVRSGGERSEPERSTGGRGEHSFIYFRRYTPVPAWQTAARCAAAEYYTCGSRDPWPAGLPAGR